MESTMKNQEPEEEQQEEKEQFAANADTSATTDTSEQAPTAPTEGEQEEPTPEGEAPEVVEKVRRRRTPRAEPTRRATTARSERRQREENERRQRAEDEEEGKLNIPAILPVLPLKDTVIYPFTVQPLGVGQERSIRLIDDVMRGDRLVAQKSAAIEQAGPKDIFKVGTVSRVARMIRMLDGTVQIIVQGLERVDIGEFTQEKPYLMAHVTPRPEAQEDDTEI